MLTKFGINDKNKEVISYIFFGGLTTVVNYIVYFLFTRVFHVDYLVSNWFAWAFAVLFAYLTNRKWVFQSTAQGFGPRMREFLAFVAARLVSLGMDMAIMYVGVSVLGIGDFWVKTVSQVVVIAANYVFSKVFVFRKA